MNCFQWEYFYNDNGVYKSEDGYGLTVTVTETGNDTIATLTDDYGNTKTFLRRLNNYGITVEEFNTAFNKL